MDESWLAAEPGLHEAWEELRYLIWRGWQIPHRPLLLSLLLGLLIGAKQLYTRPIYTGTIFYSITQGPGDELLHMLADRPLTPFWLRTKADLAFYLRSAIFSNEALSAEIRKSTFLPGAVRNNPSGFAHFLRSEVFIKPSWNLFALPSKTVVEEQGVQLAATSQSVRVEISFEDENPQVACQLVGILGRVLEQLPDKHLEVLHRVAMESREQLYALRALVVQSRTELVRREVDFLIRRESDSLEDFSLLNLIHLLRTRPNVNSARDRLKEVLRRERYLDLLGGLRPGQLPLLYVVPVEQCIPQPVVHTGRRAARNALLVALLSLPLSILIVSVVDFRVHRAADVRALGLVCVGALPEFPGVDVASYARRDAARDGAISGEGPSRPPMSGGA